MSEIYTPTKKELDRIVTIPKVLARKNALKYNEEDLESVGNLALARALHSYQQGKGTTLSSWVYTCVEMSIRGYINRCKQKLTKRPIASLLSLSVL